MKKIEEILDDWKKDATFDRTDLAVASGNVPILHSKYMMLLGDAKKMKRKLDMDKARITRELNDYYGGYCDVRDLTRMNRTPWPRKLMKNEIPEYIRSDDEYLKLVDRMSYVDDSIAVLSEIIKQINNRSFLIKDMIAWYQLTEFSA